LIAAFFFMAAPGPLGLIVLADLILRPAWSRRYFKISTRSGTSPSSVSGVDSSVYDVTPFPWVAEDFNGDGLTDIATSATTTANVDELIVFFSAGGGTFGQPTTYAVSAEPQHMVVGDFNGDGHPDIAIQYQGQGSTDGGVNAPLPIGLLLNRGDGSFGSETSYTMGPNPCWIVAADFNGDGVSDLAVVNGGSANGVTVMLSQCR
jgi:hypothetical protein